MIPVGTTPRIRVEGWMRMAEEVNSSMIFLINCKNLCKHHNVPKPRTIIKGKMQKKDIGIIPVWIKNIQEGITIINIE
jgi:hypothetical protein